MPVTFTALENGRIILFTISDPWKIEDLMAWYPVMQPYFDRAVGKVHTLFDLTSMKKMPPSALKGRHSPGMDHSNSGYVVLVGSTGLVRSVAEIAFQLSRNNRFKFMDDTEQALAFLKRQIETGGSPRGATNG